MKRTKIETQYQELSNDLLNHPEDLIIPIQMIRAIPNIMEISLSAVKGFEVRKIGSQLLDIRIDFIPNVAELRGDYND